MSCDDENAIHAMHAAFVDAWRRADADACAAHYAEDAVRVGAFGDLQRGRTEIRAAYAALFGGRMAGAAIELPEGTIRTLGADLALWQAPLAITPPGRPPLHGHIVELLRREPGRWVIVESHPKFYPSAG